MNNPRYTQVRDEPLALVPNWVAELAGSNCPSSARSQVPLVDLDSDTAVHFATVWLANEAPIAQEGAGGDATTVHTAACMKDKGISDQMAFQLMAEYWNPRCEPPWDQDELEIKVANGYRYCQQNQPGADSPEADFMDEPPDLHKPSLRISNRGAIKPNFENCLRALDHANLGLAFDEISQRAVLLCKKLPWKVELGREINDTIIRFVRHFLLEQYRVEFPKEHVVEACLTLAQQNPFNSVTQYLSGLEWDGHSRLDSWLIDYLGAEDTGYIRAVGRAALVAAVRRARKPGSKFDTVPILEGRQGSGKSTALSILAGEWFSDAELGKVDSKDAPMILQGVWIHELGELTAMTKSESEALKAFVSRREDRFRAPYDRLPQSQPRRCIFFGTTNSTAYLRDMTGNRRFWPIATRTIDLAGLRKDRDQIWAEAAEAESEAEAIELPEELWPAAAEQQARRHAEDPWCDQISEWLIRKDVDRVHTRTVLNEILELDAGRTNQAFTKRLREVMEALGWDYKRGVRVDGVSGAGYVRWTEREDIFN